MLKYFGSDQRIIKAVQMAEKFFNHPTALRDIVLSRKSCEYSTASPDELLHIMQLFWSGYTVTIYSETIRNWLGFRKSTPVLAYTTSSKSLVLIENNLNRSLQSIAGTIIHELTHNADFANPRHSFGHGDNSSHRKETTFPYYIGYAGKAWLERN